MRNEWRRAPIIVRNSADHSGEGPTREVPQAMKEGTKEEGTVEGRQGGSLPAFKRLSWEVRYSSLKACPGPEAKLLGGNSGWLSELGNEQINGRSFLRG